MLIIIHLEILWKMKHWGLSSGGPVVKNLPSNAGDMGSIRELRFHIPQGN